MTSESDSEYIGRFAPSPTGPLHLGSLLTAYASYCDAIKNNGRWLVRIEDIDPLREINGASKVIIDTLKKFGFEFDKDILFQSNEMRQNAYSTALSKLASLNATYKCGCSRAELKNISTINHTCRNQDINTSAKYSIKVRVPDKLICFEDAVQGHYCRELEKGLGDFIIKRKEGYFSYQLAVTIDDDFQNITHIVRGTDLLDSTPWQMYLNQLLGFKQPQYAHIPILVNHAGQKLSKQTFAKDITNEDPIQILHVIHTYLNQTPFPSKCLSLNQLWEYAIENWDINKIPKTMVVTV